MTVSLGQLVSDMAAGIAAVDSLAPVALSHRTSTPYQPGIGPHTEAQTVRLVLEHLAATDPTRYAQYCLGVPYGGGTRQSCDLCLGHAPDWDWAVEVKMFRLMGDNAKPNDNILMHLLSPYPAHRSALTDCDKLLGSALGAHKAVLIYGYDYPDWPMDLGIEAFETLARARVQLGERMAEAFQGLVHPVHQRGRVFAWELGPSVNS